jgi:hypothetical protein
VWNLDADGREPALAHALNRSGWALTNAELEGTM